MKVSSAGAQHRDAVEVLGSGRLVLDTAEWTMEYVR
jgi:hypothetical protein